MTRAEHLNWCKKRALAYLDAKKPSDAISSMLSDLDKHDETAGSVGLGAALCPLFSLSGNTMDSWIADLRRWVEGFN